jgi:hypothetical protein
VERAGRPGGVDYRWAGRSFGGGWNLGALIWRSRRSLQWNL